MHSSVTYHPNRSAYMAEYELGCVSVSLDGNANQIESAVKSLRYWLDQVEEYVGVIEAHKKSKWAKTPALFSSDEEDITR